MWSRTESWSEVHLLVFLSFCVIGPLWGVSTYLAIRNSRRIAIAVAMLVFLATSSFLSWWHIAIFSSRTWGARSLYCANNLRLISLAMKAYHNKYGRFPPAYIADAQGKPIHSWRVLLLPFLDQEALFQRYSFSEPWDGPNNRQLQRTIVSQYHCPSGSAEPTATSYVAVVGPTTAWPGIRPLSILKRGNEIGDKLLLAEVANSKINWIEPKDLPYSTMDFQVNGSPINSISSHHSRGAHAVTVAGRVIFVENEEPPEKIRQLLTIAPKT